MSKSKTIALSALIILAFVISAIGNARTAVAQEKPEYGRVLYVQKWNIRPDKADAYREWARGAIGRTLAPGVVEFRGFQPASGKFQVVITHEFADLAAWDRWYAHEDVQKVLNEIRTFVTDLTRELWGPSPIVQAPVRPAK